jgi:hypothetical protein
MKPDPHAKRSWISPFEEKALPSLRRIREQFLSEPF